MSERDQRNAARKVENLRARIVSVADSSGGRLFNTAGDGFMLEFGSAGSALNAIQSILDKRGKGEPPIRVGAHVGEVVVTATDDLLGHGVNVAARLQELAEPGTALVSAEFRSMARTSPTAAFQSKGQKPLDNIDQRVQTFEILSKRQKFARAFAPRGRNDGGGYSSDRTCVLQPDAVPVCAKHVRAECAGCCRNARYAGGRQFPPSRSSNSHRPRARRDFQRLRKLP